MRVARLPFVLPDFTRMAWVSDEAHAHWAPIVETIKAHWQIVERETVYQGARAAAISSCHPSALTSVLVEAAHRGCTALPLELTATSAYAATARAPLAGEPAMLRVAIVQLSAAAEFQRATSANDHDAIGALLGFPPCCRAFFDAVWIADRRVDTTWRQATLSDRDADVDVRDYRPAANVLGRWMGVRAVPHLPCAFTCEATDTLAGTWRTVAASLGYEPTWAQIDAITRWPVAWSGLHGIGEIVTPVWRVIARTDATAHVVRVRVHGSEMPVYAATGLTFPYPRVAPPVTRLAGTADAAINLWTANGFSSQEAMAEAHGPVVATAKAWKAVLGSVLDLGCGNGVLARRLASYRAGGVDCDAGKIASAWVLHPHGLYTLGDLRDPLTWPEGPWDLYVCMIGRLLEGDPAALRQAIRAKPTVFYAYRDWLTQRSLEDLVAEAGQGDRRVLQRAETAAVAVVVVE